MIVFDLQSRVFFSPIFRQRDFIKTFEKIEKGSFVSLRNDVNDV